MKMMALKDFFYACPVHLNDRHFCSAIVDPEDQEKKRKEEALAREIEKVKKEYEEKQKRKKEKKEKKLEEVAKNQEGPSNSSDKKDGHGQSDEKERDEKVITSLLVPNPTHFPSTNLTF
jgi:Skp family chaperone for outer membrane proteins